MAPFGLGFFFALMAIILCIVFGAIGTIPMLITLLIGLVALSRLLA